MSTPDDESTPRPAEPAGAGEPNTPPHAAGPAGPSEPPAAPAAPAADQGFPAAPPPPPVDRGFPSAPPPPPVGYGAPAWGDGAPVVAPSEPPRTVTIAFWLYIAGAVLSVISGIITIAIVSGSRAQLLSAVQRPGINLRGATPQQAADAALVVAIVFTIVTLLFWAITLVLFAFFLRRGANWARIILTILTVLSLLNIINGYGAGFLEFALAVVAVVLIWLRPSNEYFAAVKAAKMPRT
ncbi:MAG: hypothetical protein ACTHJI_15195 [Leifsonia sp.]